MSVVAHACSGEIGLTGNAPGNQHKLLNRMDLSDEVRIGPWPYQAQANNGRTLRYVFRFINKQYAEAIALAASNGASNPHIGYDASGDRSTLNNEIRKLGYNPQNLSQSKLTVNCECDCSSFVSVCFHCATGIDIGMQNTNSLPAKLDNTGLMRKMTQFGSNTILYGDNLEVGDICIWHNSGGWGHTAIVVSEDSEFHVDYYEALNISGATNVVVSKDSNKIYGQTYDSALKNSSGPLQIKACDNDNTIRDICQILVVDWDGQLRPVYGFKKIKFSYAFVGDSRIAQLGKELNGGSNSNLLYGIVPDQNIFAQWGCRLVQYGTQTFTRTKVKVSGKVSSSYFDRVNQSYTISLYNDSGLTENSFKIIDAVVSSDLSPLITQGNESIYEEQNSMVNKYVVCEGFAQKINNTYVMQFLGTDSSPDGQECSPTLSYIDSQPYTTGTQSVNQIIATLNSSSETYGNNAFVLSDKAKELAKKANQSDFMGACFWLGINDVQVYKNAFLGRYKIGSQTEEQSASLYIKSWIDAYKELVSLYSEKISDDSQKQKRVIITSIVSTSKNEKDYFEEQGPIITKINQALKKWVDVEREKSLQDGISSNDNWIEYVELNKYSNGNVYTNAQSFVSNSDFQDYKHFTKSWFDKKFFPFFQFDTLIQEDAPSGGGETPYYGEAPTDWPCESREKEFYLKNYPRKILNWFVSRGFSSAFAIGIIANMRGESYFCPWICGDYSAEHNVSSKLWISVQGTPTRNLGGQWFEPGGYSDTSWQSRFSKIYRTTGDAKPSSFGFCQWHNTVWQINASHNGWQNDGLSMAEKAVGKQLGRGNNMQEFCLQAASHKASWQINPVGQLEYLLHELQNGYQAVWALRNAPGNVQGARQVAETFCRVFEQPPSVDVLAVQRANRAEGYWNWLVLGLTDYYGG